MTGPRAPRYWITEAGSALHSPGCRVLAGISTVEGLTRRQAATWLDRGDRRFCCRVCLPADPRAVTLAS